MTPVNYTDLHKHDFATQRALMEEALAEFDAQFREFADLPQFPAARRRVSGQFKMEIWRRRVDEAKELGLWPTTPGSEREVTQARELCEGLGLNDSDSDRWERFVADERDRRARATPGDRVARVHRGEAGQGQGEAWQEVAVQRRPRPEEPNDRTS